MVETAGHGIADYVPCYEKVCRETETVYYLQFMPYTFFSNFVTCAVPVFHAVPCQLLEQQLVVIAACRVYLLVFRGGEVNIKGAVIHQPARVFCYLWPHGEWVDDFLTGDYVLVG